MRALSRKQVERKPRFVGSSPTISAMKLQRAFLKALTWRVIGVLTTGAISYVITGSHKLAVSIALIDATIKFFGYIVHELIWERKG